MSRPPDVETLLQRNASAAPQHEAKPLLPTMKTIIVSCMDARTDPAHFMQLEPGESLVIRNAGGRVTDDVIQQIAFVAAVVRRMEIAPEIVLVHHTDCGMERLADPNARTALSEASGIADDVLANLAIAQHAESLRQDLERLRGSDLVPKGLSVTGLCFDHQTGGLETVFTEAT